MEKGKTAIDQLELPTGVQLDNKEIAKQIMFREMAGPEEDILSSKISVSQKITSILANCLLELGPIKDPITAKKYISRLVVSDRWIYLVQLRCLSLGSEYKFEVTCPKCSKADKLVVDLKTSSVKNAPVADALFHETNLPSGSVIRWKCLDGDAEATIEKMAKIHPNKEPSVALFARASEIDGRSVTFADICHLNMKDRSFFRKQIDELEGKFDDTFKAVCPECGHEYEGDLSLDAQSFFFP